MKLFFSIKTLFFLMFRDLKSLAAHGSK